MEMKDIRNALGYSDSTKFTTQAELMRKMGIKNKQSIKKYLAGLEAVDGKYYLIADVARRLKQLCRQM